MDGSSVVCRLIARDITVNTTYYPLVIATGFVNLISDLARESVRLCEILFCITISRRAKDQGASGIWAFS
jgi:hypothetical protein